MVFIMELPGIQHAGLFYAQMLKFDITKTIYIFVTSK